MRSYDSAPLDAWLATGGSGEPLGCYLLALPITENLTLARVILLVPPAGGGPGSARACR